MVTARNARKLLVVSVGGETFTRAVIWAASCGYDMGMWKCVSSDSIPASLSDFSAAVIYDQDLDSATIGEVVMRLRDHLGAIPIILATTCGSEQRAIEAMRVGCNDYLRVDAGPGEWRQLLQQCLDAAVPASVPAAGDWHGMIGQSPAMQVVRTLLERIAATDCTTLIIGETGTGKERIAEQIHRLSARRDRLLLPINCAALPDSLLESELFGYEKGAFTGAVGAYPGKLKIAEGGTLFLDEIGDMSAQGQAKLLRAIESREFYPLGARNSTRFDVRIIAATNQPLDKLVEQGLFRKDLFFRLDVVRINLPPLRERREDIVPLLYHYLAEFGRRFGRQAKFDPALLDKLMSYDWPGNIRELKNLLEAMLICSPGGRIGQEHLPSGLYARLNPQVQGATSERELLIATLVRLNWNKSQAAKDLHWSRMTLYRKLEKYAICAPEAASLDSKAPSPLYRSDSIATSRVSPPPANQGRVGAPISQPKSA